MPRKEKEVVWRQLVAECGKCEVDSQPASRHNEQGDGIQPMRKPDTVNGNSVGLEREI
jgi:hypothetical protein